MGDLDLASALPVSDRDLLWRLNQYFDEMEERLRIGQGWFIFNANGGRARRVAKFIENRLVEYQPLVSYYFVPWRDFALNAYIQEVELPAIPEEAAAALDDKARREYNIATRVSRDTFWVMAGSDLLVINGLTPSHIHELRFLDRLIEGRYVRHLPTILLTPRQLTDLSSDFHAVDPSNHYWSRVYQRMYESSLMAL